MIAQEKARLKGEGFISQREDGFFAVRIPSKSGNFTTAQCTAMTDIANTYGRGYLGLTTRMSMEIPWITADSIPAVKAALVQAGLTHGGTGKRVRPCVACKGTICVHGLYDTQEMSDQIAGAWEASATPSKCKINFAGCPNNCTKVQVNDIGVIGRRYPALDAHACVACGACIAQCRAKALTLVDGRIQKSDTCVGCGHCIPACPKGCFTVHQTGVEIYVGGVFGRTLRVGDSLGIFDVQQLPLLIGKILAWYRTYGTDGERIYQVIARLGLDCLKQAL
ncbi:MAG: (4Fe-4S)-binding protein [Clostridia bacterium]